MLNVITVVTADANYVLFCTMSVYTKTGDKGNTSLLNGERYSKDSPIFNVLGTIDELNAFLGLLYTSRNTKIRKIINEIQSSLFELGTLLANPNVSKEQLLEISNVSLKLENYIDEFDSQLPPLKNFILPSGSPVSVYLHISRSVCRRLERETICLSRVDSIYLEIIPFINRLSDLLFVLARYENFKVGILDEIWKKN